MGRRNSAIRTIKNGRVKIFGQWFVPDDRFMQYDGRLDGMRYYFGLYWQPRKDTDEWEHYMCALSSTEEAHRAITSAPSEEEADELIDYYWQPEQQPELVGNTWPWYFWMKEE